MTHKESAKLPETSVGAFDDPSAFVSPGPAPVFIRSELVGVVWDDRVDATFFQTFAQRTGVVSAAGDHPFPFLSRTAFCTRNADFGEHGVRKCNFCSRGALQTNSQ